MQGCKARGAVRGTGHAQQAAARRAEEAWAACNTASGDSRQSRLLPSTCQAHPRRQVAPHAAQAGAGGAQRAARALEEQVRRRRRRAAGQEEAGGGAGGAGAAGGEGGEAAW
jgi:hypothetical protein